MKQCQNCQRLLGDKAKNCLYCSNQESVSLYFAAARKEELTNYRFYADTINCQGSLLQIIDIIGQGSHGVVFKVIDSKGRNLALKVPLIFNELFSNSQGNKKSTLQLSEKFVTHEAAVLKQINCDALIRIFYAGASTCRSGDIEQTFPAILMELAQCTLKDIMDNEMAKKLTLPFAEKAEIIKQLTGNIESLHRQNIIHRDLSPDNIFVVERGERIEYVLADFGTSRPIAAENRSKSTRLAFHERYADPALMLDENFRYDCRIDIYQLGIISTEILLGEYWQANDTGSAADLPGINFANDFLLRFAVHELSPALLARLKKATALNPQRRFCSASEFHRQMQQTLDREIKKRQKIAPQNRFKKNIFLTYELKYDCNGNTVSEEIPVIIYTGQKRIAMDLHSAMTIKFIDLQLQGAAIVGPSFLQLKKSADNLSLAVDRAAIRRRLRPLLPLPTHSLSANFMTRLFSNLKQINLEKKQDNLLSKLLILRSRVGKKKAKCSAATIELSGQAVLAISVSRSQ